MNTDVKTLVEQMTLEEKAALCTGVNAWQTTAVERLESEQRHLERLSESASLDQELGMLVNEGLVTATLEIHRFRSGAYI